VTPTTRVVVSGAVAAATLVGLVVLADATRYRGEIESADDRTTVVFEVRTRGHGEPEAAAAALWLTCATAHGPAATWGPDETGPATYRASLSPSLGEEARRRLRGCLADTTVERALGSVVTMVNEPIPAGAADDAVDGASPDAGAP
jgi:hypothetical protein